MFRARHDVRDTGDYLFQLEEWDEGLLVHFSARRWAPSVLRTALREWKLFRQAVPQPLFAIGPPHEDAKWRRFVSLFGFKLHSTVALDNGETRSRFISTTT